MAKILVVAAHPDDETLGMGGTLAKLIKNREEIYLLFLATGIYARKKNKEKMKRELKNLRKHAIMAAKVMGIAKDNIFFENYPDNAMDTIPFLEIVRKVESYIGKIKPKKIFTHHYNDLNVDHSLSFKSVLTATRPIVNGIELISFEVPSCTEWTYPYSFKPNYFIDVSHTYKLKLAAMKEYKGEIREYPHPRSLKILDAYMTRWGSVIGVQKAEAFEIIRKIEFIKEK